MNMQSDKCLAARAAPPLLALAACAGRGAAEIRHHRHRRRHRRLLRGRRRDLPADEQGPRQDRHPLLGGIDRRLGVQRQRHQGAASSTSAWRSRTCSTTPSRARASSRTRPSRDLRAVFSVHPEPFTVLARKEANVTKFEDFKGKRFNVGNPGSGTRASMEQLLGAMGWKHDRLLARLRTQGRRARPGAVRQQDRRLLLRRRPSLGEHPGPDHDLRRQARPADRPGGRQADQGESLLSPRRRSRAACTPTTRTRPTTYGVLATLVTSAKVPDDVVYNLVKATFDNFDEFKKLHPAFANLDPDQDGEGRPLGAAASGRGEVLQGKGLDVTDGTERARRARAAPVSLSMRRGESRRAHEPTRPSGTRARRASISKRLVARGRHRRAQAGRHRRHG